MTAFELFFILGAGWWFVGICKLMLSKAYRRSAFRLAFQEKCRTYNERVQKVFSVVCMTALVATAGPFDV